MILPIDPGECLAGGLLKPALYTQAYDSWRICECISLISAGEPGVFRQVYFSERRRVAEVLEFYHVQFWKHGQVSAKTLGVRIKLGREMGITISEKGNGDTVLAIAHKIDKEVALVPRVIRTIF